MFERVFSNDVWGNAWTGTFKHRSVIFLHDAETQGKILNPLIKIIVVF